MVDLIKTAEPNDCLTYAEPVLTAIAGVLAAAVLTVTPLPSGTDVDYQLGGVAPPAANVGIVVRDRTAPPAPGAYDICYINGFQAQTSERGFWQRHAQLLLHDHAGRVVVDEGWHEPLLDVGTAAHRRALARIVGRWVDGCAAAGYQAVEFDNLDSFTRSHGLLSRTDATAYASLLVQRAHAAGLAAGQKNLAGYDGRRIGYDFAISEECGRYDECGDYVAHYGDAVLMIEYRRRDFDATCAAYGGTHPVELRDRDLTPDGVHAWC